MRLLLSCALVLGGVLLGSVTGFAIAAAAASPGTVDQRVVVESDACPGIPARR